MLTPILLSLCFSQLGDGSAITPKPREEAWWLQRVTKIQNEVDNSRKNASVIFVGDSITQGWEGSGEAVWDSAFNRHGALNLGIGGDRTEHVLWRLEHGHLDGIEPQLAVVMIGTNNFGGGQDSIDEVYEGVFVVRLFYRWMAQSLDWTDRSIVDGVVRSIDRLGRNAGRAVGQIQTGQVQGYGLAISIGVLGIIGFYALFQ